MTPLSIVPLLSENTILSRRQKHSTVNLKAKACARCRQYKLRCDSNMAAPASCSRCRGVNAVCVVDTNYQCVSKTRRLMELEAEVNPLATTEPVPEPEPESESESGPESRRESGPESPYRPREYWTSGSRAFPFRLCFLSSSTAAAARVQPLTTSPTTRSSPSSDSRQTQYSILLPEREPELHPANFQLSAAQVIQCFRKFFLQCHPWLDFSIPTSPEAVHPKNPLLFWVICAVSSSTNTMLRLQPGIQEMIG
jgi:hypothetical protein